MNKLFCYGVLYCIRNNGKNVKVMLELYNKTPESYEYEFKVNTYEDMQFIHEFLKKLN